MAPDRSNLILVSNLILLTGVESGGHNSTLLARVTSRHHNVHYGNLSDGGTRTSTLVTCMLMSSPSPQQFHNTVAVAETRDWSVVSQEQDSSNWPGHQISRVLSKRCVSIRHLCKEVDELAAQRISLTDSVCTHVSEDRSTIMKRKIISSVG